MADLADFQSAETKPPAAAPPSPGSLRRRSDGPSDEPSDSDQLERDQREAASARRSRFIIALLVALFLATFWQRDFIRSHWWALRLMATDDLASRGQYLSYVATVGGKAEGAIRRLARDDRPDVRILAVMAASKLPRPASSRLLSDLLVDSDVDVREAAGRTLVFAFGDDALRLLSGVSGNTDAAIAASAVACLARIGSPATASFILFASTHRNALVRAQAIETMVAWLGAGDIVRQEAETCYKLLDRLAEMMQDDASFSGELSLEREIRRSAAFVGRQGMVSAVGIEQPERRIVSDLAVAALSRLAGHPIPKESPISSERRYDVAMMVVKSLQDAPPERAATSLPIDLEQLDPPLDGSPEHRP